MQKIRIMIAGTRQASFQALARIVGRASDAYQVSEQLWNEAEAVKLVRENNADVVLVDASAGDGFDFCEKLTSACSNICAILVGGRRSYEWLKRAMDAGARGYIAEDECTGEGVRREIDRVYKSMSGPISDPAPVEPDLPIAAKSRAVLRAADFVRQNYRGSISAAEAAEYAGISESHLRRCFRREAGVSFVEYLTEYRVCAAKLLLEDGNMSIRRISEETGFSSARYFCGVFKKITGFTPREYQQKTRTGEDAE